MTPYEETWVSPETVVEHRGVKVYRTYMDDEVDQGHRTNSFVLREDDNEENSLDMRELGTWKEPEHPPFQSPAEIDTPRNCAAWNTYWENRVEVKAIIAALIASIEAGTLHSPDPDDFDDHGWVAPESPVARHP